MCIRDSPETGQLLKLKIDTAPFEPVTSIEIDALGAPNVDFPNRYSDVRLLSITYQGSAISFNDGQYKPGGMPINGGTSAYMNPGTNVVFAAPTLPRAPPP